MRAEKTLVLKTLSMVKSNSDILNEETCHQNYNTKQKQKKVFNSLYICLILLNEIPCVWEHFVINYL